MKERKQYESIIDYIERITNSKKELDLDYSEIYNLITGIILSSDESRKRIYGWKDLIELLKKEGFKNLTEDEIFEKLERRKQELYKEQVKLSTLRNNLREEARDTARKELLFEEILRVIPKVQQVTFNELKSQSSKQEYMLCITDIHFNSIFNSINNEYSIDIVKQRFEKLLNNVKCFIEKENISKLYVSNLGDSIQGIIRISDLRKNQIGLMESVVAFSRFMGDWLNQLSKYVEIIYYHVPTANHSDVRLFDISKNHTGENLEVVIVNYIHDYLKNNNRVKVVLPVKDKDYHELSLFNYELIMLHGHQLSKGKNNLDKLSARHRKWYDYCLVGHFHGGKVETVGEGETNDREYIIVPSVVGSDPYSDSLMVGAKSSALMLTFDEKEGLINKRKFILN